MLQLLQTCALSSVHGVDASASSQGGTRHVHKNQPSNADSHTRNSHFLDLPFLSFAPSLPPLAACRALRPRQCAWMITHRRALHFLECFYFLRFFCRLSRSVLAALLPFCLLLVLLFGLHEARQRLLVLPLEVLHKKKLVTSVT